MSCHLHMYSIHMGYVINPGHLGWMVHILCSASRSTSLHSMAHPLCARVFFSSFLTYMFSPSRRTLLSGGG